MLRAFAVIMLLVPVGTIALLTALPDEIRRMPLWFWVIWCLVSIWAIFDAPVRIESLAPSTHVHESAMYAQWARILAIANLGSSVAAVIYLGWWS